MVQGLFTDFKDHIFSGFLHIMLVMGLSISNYCHPFDHFSLLLVKESHALILNVTDFLG
jgi:hypothetical protein